MRYRAIHLGQSIVAYETPLDIFLIINRIYETNFQKLIPANKQLIGKIKKEHSLFNSEDTEAMPKNNVLPQIVIKYFLDCMHHYLKYNSIENYKVSMSSVWVNEMEQHEYNPIHIHQGALFTGLSSVMILKLPESFGEEYSSVGQPQNGKLQIVGSDSGQFARTDYQPYLKERLFYIFPYDMRHTVDPFNGPGVRRSLACNCDVEYNPVKNRGIYV